MLAKRAFRRHKCFAGIGGGIRKTNAKERTYHKNFRRKRPALQPDSSYRKWQARTEYIHSQFDKLDKRMFKGFTKEELSLLNSFLNRLIDNISEDAPSEKAIFEMMMKSHEKGGDDNV